MNFADFFMLLSFVPPHEKSADGAADLRSLWYNSEAAKPQGRINSYRIFLARVRG
jgi:hypothetical protein